MKRHSVRCSLCKSRFMTELPDMETASRHAQSCERFAARLTARIDYRTRAVASCKYEWAKDPKHIYDDELYQMRALYLQFSRVEGHVNDQIPCDGRCYNARGGKCECSCGGHNHGAGNAATCGMQAVAHA